MAKPIKETLAYGYQHKLTCLVFCNSEGAPIEPDNMAKRNFLLLACLEKKPESVGLGSTIQRTHR